jgi:hypothetical protein
MSLRPKAVFQIKQTRYFGMGAGGFRTLIAGTICLLGSFLLLFILSLAILALLRFSFANIGFSAPTDARQQPPPVAVDVYQKKKNFSFAVRSDEYFFCQLFIIYIIIGCAIRNCSVVISSRISSSRCDDLPGNSASPPLSQLQQLTANSIRFNYYIIGLSFIHNGVFFNRNSQLACDTFISCSLEHLFCKLGYCVVCDVHCGIQSYLPRNCCVQQFCVLARCV